MFESWISAGGTGNHFVLRNLTRTCPLRPMMWKVMQRNAWKDFANWRIKQLNSYTKVATACLDDHQFKEEEWDLLESCQKFARKLSSNVCNWHALVDRTLYGPWTNLHVLSPNGPEHATNVQHVWSHTFITYVNSNNIVMREIQPNSAGWYCFRTLALTEILKTQKQLREDFCAYLEVIHSYQ